MLVETVRLNQYLKMDIDFLKIDVEGAELRIIKDCRDDLERVQNIFIEYHGNRSRKQRLHEMLHIIQQAGFRYHVQDANPINHPFIERERGNLYDLQLNIFGFRGDEVV